MAWSAIRASSFVLEHTSLVESVNNRSADGSLALMVLCFPDQNDLFWSSNDHYNTVFNIFVTVRIKTTADSRFRHIDMSHMLFYKLWQFCCSFFSSSNTGDDISGSGSGMCNDQCFHNQQIMVRSTHRPRVYPNPPVNKNKVKNDGRRIFPCSTLYLLSLATVLLRR